MCNLYWVPIYVNRASFVCKLQAVKHIQARVLRSWTNLSNSLDRSPYWETDSFSCTQIHAFFVTRRFINVSTRPRRMSLYWARLIHSALSHPVFLKAYFNIILSYTPRASRWFLSGFPTKTLYVSLCSAIRATCPVLVILFDLLTRTVFDESFLQSCLSSSPLDPNIFVSTLFSNTCSYCYQ